MEIIIHTHFNFLFYQDYIATFYLNESLCLFTNSKESDSTSSVQPQVRKSASWSKGLLHSFSYHLTNQSLKWEDTNYGNLRIKQMKYSLSLRFSNEIGVWCKEKTAQLHPRGYRRKKEEEKQERNRSTLLNFLSLVFSSERKS